MKGSIRKKGDAWYYRIELGVIDGKRKQKEKGGFKLKRDCEAAMNKAIYDYENNFVLPDDKLTLDDIMQNYLAYIKTNRKLNTYNRYADVYKNYIKSTFGGTKAMKVMPEALETLFTDLNYLSGSTLRLVYAVINGAYNRAIKQKKLNDNPCKYIDRPTKEKHETEILTLDELQKVLDSLDLTKDNDYIMFLAISICAELGLRRGELAALQWKHINNNDKTVTVQDNLVYIKGHTYLNENDPKTPASKRIIPVSDNLLKILEKHRKKQMENKLRYGEHYINNIYNDEIQNFIMTWANGKAVHPDYYSGKINDYISKVGIEKKIRFHDLRHTNATLLIQQKVDFKTLQKRLGHADFSTTMDTYAHVAEELERDATDKISSILYKAK